MSDTPGAQLREEPQAERGAPGSRDTGSDEPAGGPVDRPADTAGEDSDTGIEAQSPIDDAMPTLQKGDQGG